MTGKNGIANHHIVVKPITVRLDQNEVSYIEHFIGVELRTAQEKLEKLLSQPRSRTDDINYQAMRVDFFQDLLDKFGR